MGLTTRSEWLNRVALPEFTGQGLRFIISGGFVALCNVGVTSLLVRAIGIAFPVAIAVGYVVAITIHFSLQRFFVWSHDADFVLDMRGQLARYLPLALGQYAIVAGATLTLPGALGLPDEVVYLGAVVILSVAAFLLFGSRVFHHLDEI